jgi:hypothetical protein
MSHTNVGREKSVPFWVRYLRLPIFRQKNYDKNRYSFVNLMLLNYHFMNNRMTTTTNVIFQSQNLVDLGLVGCRSK